MSSCTTDLNVTELLALLHLVLSQNRDYSCTLCKFRDRHKWRVCLAAKNEEATLIRICKVEVLSRSRVTDCVAHVAK